MASGAGYALIPGAISPSLVQQAILAIKGNLKVKRETEKYTEYEVPSICNNIRDEFIKNTGESSLTQFLNRQPVPQLRSVNVGVFRETNTDPKKVYGAGKEEIYVTIALTDLNPGNGWYIFIERSYDRSPASQTFWKDASITLKAGDAVVWRGDLLYRHPPGGEGTFVTLVYT
ncbi:hypothetical protein K432DRAFT_310376 [Lepidopterella palustris CBS 459.81]|uniref:Uncharacterized protein n=1 Tax=Lepidopterella palustris CBS 459.81 TaxID=1314670 RepID=A0A8E2DZL4_9PEZI|nr:hypothetical protein K432DRAFT_310376 [Lepidopterella palustris CBS 459.81]